jgi:hypothetical protein
MAKRIAFSSECRTTKELFGPVPGAELNVALDTFGHEFLLYAGGYKRAGDTVVQNLRRSDKQVLVFPVGYLYHHYLELMIKGLTRLANAILSGKVIYSGGHDIAKLWEGCRPLLERVMPRYSKAGFNDVGKCIEAFASFDFEGLFFRYPEDTECRPWPQPMEGVNLQKIRDAVSDAAERFESYYLEMNSMLEHLAETSSYAEVCDP